MRSARAHGRVGVAVVGAIISSRVAAGHAAAMPDASHPAWWTLTACGMAVLALGLIGTTRRAAASAHQTALELNPEAIGA